MNEYFTKSENSLFTEREIRQAYKNGEIFVKTKKILQELANRQGHNKCWYNPEVIKELLELYEIKPTVSPNLPSPEEFAQGCFNYQKELYEGTK